MSGALLVGWVRTRAGARTGRVGAPGRGNGDAVGAIVDWIGARAASSTYWDKALSGTGSSRRQPGSGLLIRFYTGWEPIPHKTGRVCTGEGRGTPAMC